MAIKCKKCKFVDYEATGLHTMTQCRNCGQKDRDMFVRVEVKDYTDANHEADNKWLEAHRADKNEP